MTGVLAGSQLHRQCIAGQHRHVDVKQNEIGLELTHKVHHADPLAQSHYFAAFVFQQRFRDIEQHFVIVYEQYFLFRLH